VVLSDNVYAAPYPTRKPHDENPAQMPLKRLGYKVMQPMHRPRWLIISSAALVTI